MFSFCGAPLNFGESTFISVASTFSPIYVPLNILLAVGRFRSEMAETKSDAVYSASVWGRTDFDNGSETAVSFADVMSQDLAIELQAK